MGVAFDSFRQRYHIDHMVQDLQRIPAANLLAGAIIHVAHGISTVHPEMDFETYSEAGHKFDPEKGKFVGIGSKKGLSAVGSAAYAQHPSTEVICLAYNLKDGLGPRLWYPGDPLPWDLFGHIQRGGLIEAHNSIFEYFIWTFVCVKKLGWPPLNFKQLRCSMSKAAAFALPMALDKLTAATDAPIKKDKEGQALMRKLSQPKAPTAKNKSLRYTRAEYPAEHARTGVYCINDTYAESEVSAMLPDLQPEELELWLLDQQINIRGVHIDKASLNNCISIVEQAFSRYSEELKQLCGQVEDEEGELQWRVTSPAELDNIKDFLELRGIKTASLDKDHVAKLLARNDLPPDVRRVVEIRDMLSASSVKKLFSLLHHLCDDNRVRGLFAFCGADRTGRFAGRGPQPQNMPGSGPTLLRCDKISGCGHHYQKALKQCPWCNTDAAFSEPKEWGPIALEQALKVISSRNLHYVEHYFGDAIAVVSGCLRGLFTAAPGKDLISSDFSAIEAVVLAELAGEKWRQEVFRTHGKIYEMGAAMITGTPFEEFMRVAGYPDITKEGWWEDEPTPGAKHHPLRKTIGKVSELACFGGDTLILTSTGYKRITDISNLDLLWDGFEWVTSDGVIERGHLGVHNLDGVAVTLDHKILSYHGWTTAHDLLYSEFKEDAYDFGDSHLPPEGVEFDKPHQTCGESYEQEVFDILNCGKRNAFTILTNRGHLIVHNSGYAGWIGAWKNFGADKFMNDQEIKNAILAWRKASPMIEELWGGQWRKHPSRWEFTPDFFGLEGAAIQAVMNPGIAYQYRYITYQCHADVLYCRLPSGRLLSYHKPRLVQSVAPHKNPIWQLTYMGQDEVGRWIRLNTYGGKLTENCCEFSTPVLTNRGWIKIGEVLDTDLIHDGVEFVAHGGKIFKSSQPCVKVDGLLMTGDHRVLEPSGWKAASQCKRPYRPKIRRADLPELESYGRKEKLLGVPMRVWEALHEERNGYNKRSKKGWKAKLRLSNQKVNKSSKHGARYVPSPCLRCLASNERPLSSTDTPRMGKLRGSRHSSLPTLDRQLRKLLGGYARRVSERFGAGSAGQQRWVLERQLPMGISKSEFKQSSEKCEGKNTLRRNDSERCFGPLGHSSLRNSRSIAKEFGLGRFNLAFQSAPVREQKAYEVWDILNCGPRNRFVVKGDSGPFIVHNCTQAVARDILTFAMKNLEAAGYPIVLHIHDEIVCEVDKGWGSVEELEQIMARMPDWCKDWPVRAAGGWRGLRYRKG